MNTRRSWTACSKQVTYTFSNAFEGSHAYDALMDTPFTKYDTFTTWCIQCNIFVLTRGCTQEIPYLGNVEKH